MRIIALLLGMAFAAPLGSAADGDSIESLTKVVYDVLSGPAGPRDWARFRSLFAEGARLIVVRTSGGHPAPLVMTVDEFVTRSGSNTQTNGFWESEAAHRVESFADIAHVFSTYESRHAPEEKPFARGINSFHLVKVGDAWKVMTILWEAEREGVAIPERYLPAGK